MLVVGTTPVDGFTVLNSSGTGSTRTCVTVLSVNGERSDRRVAAATDSDLDDMVEADIANVTSRVGVVRSEASMVPASVVTAFNGFSEAR